MGAWGCESCSNDYVWDWLFAEDIHNMTQAEADDSLKKVFAQKDNQENNFEKLGVVVWLLTHGLRVPISKLRQALKYAKAELDPKLLEDWSDGRKECVEQEIVEIREAIKNGGKGKVRHVKGLFERMDDFIGG